MCSETEGNRKNLSYKSETEFWNCTVSISKSQGEKYLPLIRTVQGTETIVPTQARVVLEWPAIPQSRDRHADHRFALPPGFCK